ncbi:hypothetical protein BST36_03390 [Mycolicibacterium moriokaense]|uniref:DUF2613 domain-containing protein n=1 Tax=Mycolicibacterium moriokaense TaxID=39691 RepID=A0AAD1HC77_9MYCO|nr:hypothetical protein [Mycolicibacterium moriokaense]MCV7040530.1 hypothetical protein [Mycolicibacterium moriokaense]ORB26298.1 hypothetical protein BST36_03390 [Mycolicibacterium moriokaense]BBX02758.1 hypothetical protein MMOR_36940 [Mycolicibacterium moriokaense]
MTNTTITHRIARYIALPIMSAGIVGGAALGMAGMANAATTTPSGPGYSYAPSVKAPAGGQLHHHHGVNHVETVEPLYQR